MHVLLGFVRVVPLGLGLESAGLLVEFDRRQVDVHDAFERVDDGACTQRLDAADSCRTIPQADGIVIAVRKSKSHQEPARRVDAERVDQFLAQEAHGRRAENDHALLVQTDDALVGAKVEQFGQLQIVDAHASTILRRHGPTNIEDAVSDADCLTPSRQAAAGRSQASRTDAPDRFI